MIIHSTEKLSVANVTEHLIKIVDPSWLFLQFKTTPRNVWNSFLLQPRKRFLELTVLKWQWNYSSSWMSWCGLVDGSHRATEGPPWCWSNTSTGIFWAITILQFDEHRIKLKYWTSRPWWCLTKACGAAVCILSIDAGGEVSTNLAMFKSRVAPTKAVLIPGLELIVAAINSAWMLKFVAEQLSFKIDCVACWTDMMRRGRFNLTKWKTFAANRVNEIQATLLETFFRRG